MDKVDLRLRGTVPISPTPFLKNHEHPVSQLKSLASAIDPRILAKLGARAVLSDLWVVMNPLITKPED